MAQADWRDILPHSRKARTDTPLEAIFPGDSELAYLMRIFNWAAHPLGPPERWPTALKTSIGIMLTSAQPIWVGWGNELSFLYNDPYKSIIGGKHPTALGQPTKTVWREIWSEIGPMLAQTSSGVSGIYVESQPLIMERNGYPEETYYTFSYSPIREDDGMVRGVFCANTDDTERVIGERRLKILRELAADTALSRTWQAACEQSAKALALGNYDLPFSMIYALDGKAETASLVACAGIDRGHPAAPPTLSIGRNDGWPLAEAIGAETARLVSDVTARFDEPLPKGAWDRATEHAVILPIPAGGERGRLCFLIAGLSPYLLFDDRYEGFLELVGRQIAAAIANADAYEQEKRRAEALIELDRAKTTFFSNVSHEFRTPLTLMISPLEDLLGDNALPTRQRDNIELAHRNSIRLLKLVNTLLDFSRIEAGRMQANYRPVDLGQFTTELAAAFQSIFDKAGLELIVETRPLASTVYVDADLWEKIIFNLLSNALKFTFKGAVHVVVQNTADGAGAEVKISDTGTGIAESDLPYLFERFRRVEGAYARSHEGSGIGLALVQELVRLHRGTITVASVVGEGTTFTITIPFGSMHLPSQLVHERVEQPSTRTRAQAYIDEVMGWLDNIDVNETPAASSPADVMEIIPTLSQGEFVLLADDNAEMRRYVTRLLREAGFHVETHPDGATALQAARLRRPDLVLTDVMMPNLDGVGLLTAFREDQALRDVPIILLSARAGEEATVEGLRSGADDYLVKPFSARELLARVSSNLNHARTRRLASSALRTSEERFRAFVMASSDVVFRMAADWSEMQLLAGQALIADTSNARQDWMHRYIHPDDRTLMADAVAKAIAERAKFELEYRVIRDDGTTAWFLSRAIPLLDAAGEISEWFGTATDVTERKRHEARQLLLLNELNHRVKNTLATVQSMARQSLRHALRSKESWDVFNGRLIALSKAHDVLTREQWQGADLREVVHGALNPYLGDGQEHRLLIAGPNIRLVPKAALAFSLALHELATNALKYGSIVNETGRVEVTWRIDNVSQELFFTWKERGGRPVTPPTARGFGSRLIEQGLSQDLNGSAILGFLEDGVQCSISAPLAEISSHPDSKE
jgi:signal transduction histidine kinase/DNA-binding response OmpR family regulator